MTTARCGIRKHRYFDDVDEYYLGMQHEVMGQQKEAMVEDDKKEASCSPRAQGAAEILIVAEILMSLSKIDPSFEPKDQLPFGVHIPKRRRGSCGRSLPQKGADQNTAADDDDRQEVKGSIDINAAPVDGLGFNKTQIITTEPQSKIHPSTTVGGFIVRPLGILAPKKKAANSTRLTFGKKNGSFYCIGSVQEVLKGQEKKVCRKRVLSKSGRDEDDQVRASNKCRRIDFEKVGLDPPPNYSSHIKARIDYQDDRDSELKLRIMKQIFTTDLNTHHGRFTMPWKQIRDLKEFLNEDELIVGAEFEVKLLEVGLNGDEVHESTMRLRNWRMSNTICCALRSGWNDVLARNQGVLNENDIVQVYSFRRDNKLWLVLIKVMDVEEVRRRLMAADQVGRNSSTRGNHGGNCLMM